MGLGSRVQASHSGLDNGKGNKMVTPPAGTKPGTAHVLDGRGIKKIFVWMGAGWSASRGNRYSTKPSAMATLGWKYVGIAAQSAEEE